MTTKKVSVVILNWNGCKLLKQFLPSVVKYTTMPDVRIVVADNASTDGSVKYLKDNYPTIDIIELSENYGFAEGYNKALQQIDSEYFLLLNSDVEVTHSWLEPMINYLDKNLEVAAAQPKILSQRKKDEFEYAGAAGGYIDRFGFPFCRGRVFETVEKDLGQYNTIENIFWASGACLLVRAKDFIENGGFDSAFFAHMEEIDFCWRLIARGRKIVCLPNTVVYHVGGATLEEGSSQKVYLNFRNNMLMLYKNLGESKLNSTLRKRRYLNIVAALKFYFSGEKEKAKAIFRAHKDYKKLQEGYKAIRQKNIEMTIVADIPEIYQGNLIVDYYLKGKKRFKDIF